MSRRFLCLTIALLWVGSAFAESIEGIVVDASKPHGRIRSLQGVNLGPLHTKNGLDLTKQYREMQVDFIRTHDFFGPTDIDSKPKDRGANLVIFPDWNADPEKEESYRFGPSDRVIQGIAGCGASICYRLGRSFSADPTPPPEFRKFAEVCRHIVMHYNAGWANGHHFNIKYWEVWNEPNVDKTWVPNKYLHPFWSGTREQFFELYEITARSLKAYDPTLKIGGPGLAEGCRESPWREGFVEFCAKSKVPLDFLSWHHYHGDSSDPWDMVRIAKDIRGLLDAHGLNKTESHVNEWNLNLTKNSAGPQNQASLETAAFTASALMYLQDAPLDRSFFYTGNAGNMGCFETNGTPRKRAFALKATGAMLDTPQRLKVKGGDTMGFAVLAGESEDKQTVQVLISNYQIQQPTEPPRQSAPAGSHGLARRKIRSLTVEGYSLVVNNLPWGKSSFTMRRYRLDAAHDFAFVEQQETAGETFRLTNAISAPAVELLVLKAGR